MVKHRMQDLEAFAQIKPYIIEKDDGVSGHELAKPKSLGNSIPM